MSVINIRGTIAERVASLETEVTMLKASDTVHARKLEHISDKIDRLSFKLLGATCAIIGALVGSKMISPETIETIKSIFIH